MPAANISVVPSAEPAADDPVPAEVLAVIDLFATQLAKVAFPDLDAATLRRQAEDLRGEAKSVAAARAALEAALATLADKRAALSAAATRALAYARIYSDAHPDRAGLASALAALDRPEPVTPAPKRRGRPPKRSAELFDVPPDGAAPE